MTHQHVCKGGDNKGDDDSLEDILFMVEKGAAPPGRMLEVHGLVPVCRIKGGTPFVNNAAWLGSSWPTYFIRGIPP